MKRPKMTYVKANPYKLHGCHECHAKESLFPYWTWDGYKMYLCSGCYYEYKIGKFGREKQRKPWGMI